MSPARTRAATSRAVNRAAPASNRLHAPAQADRMRAGGGWRSRPRWLGLQRGILPAADRTGQRQLPSAGRPGAKLSAAYWLVNRALGSW